jgi:hypothetical protein
MSASNGSDSLRWQSAVRSLSSRIHFGWWLDRWVTLLIPLGFVGSFTILGLRITVGLTFQSILSGIASGVLISAAAAYLWMHRHRESLAQTRVRLEDALGLKTSLTTAAQGVGQWPPFREGLPSPITFQLGRPILMVAFGALVLAAAILVPVTQTNPKAPRIIEPPSALKEVQAWIDEVKKNDSVNPESIDQVEDKIAELLQRPAQNWYEHASLEAADNLRDVTASDLQQLAQNLAEAERTASALASSASGSGLPQAAKDSLEQAMRNASQSMKGAGMQPGSELMDALKSIDPSQLSNMSAEQLKDLAEQFSLNHQTLQEALKKSPSLDLSKIPQGKSGEGDGETEKEGPGVGSPKRGPGTTPVTLASEDTQLNSEKIGNLKNPLDLSRVAIGDAISVTDGTAKVDSKAYTGPLQGGSAAFPGDGGAAVWQNSLIPAERETLKRFFK